MAQPRKFEGVADLDTAPDIYETPDLTDDTSTIPASSVPRPSSAGSYYEDASEGELDSGISKSRLVPSKAREQFFSNNVDAREVDFSDRVNNKRKSYRTSNRRRRKVGGNADEDEEYSDEEESFEKKLARLRREVEEVKAEHEQRKSNTTTGSLGENGEAAADGTDGVVQLSLLLDEIYSSQREKSGRETPLAQRLGRGFAAVHVPDGKATDGSAKRDQLSAQTRFTVDYAPNYEQSHALAKAADLDARLALLEKYIGSTSSIPGTKETTVPEPILPALEHLGQQLTTIATASPSSLDAVGHKIHQSLQDAERLDDLRKQNRESSRPASGRGPPRQQGSNEQQSAADETNQSAKINALYSQLSKIETLSPLLPPVLDRLHTLRAVHANAARASEGLEEVEARQQDMTEEIKRWREGLEKVEQGIKRYEGTMKGNLETVEGWVKELEGRVGKLS
ncbi:MAG: hypothetical protein M1820_006441 [Bogoriella megaspora]|nr:MAG: hypothetical protein M1820_006441 [Bogoriella megaspora]